MRERQKRRVFRSVAGTVLLTAALLLSFAFFHHVLPLQLARRQPARQVVPTAAPVAVTPAPELSGETPAPVEEDGRSQCQIRFADHFTDEVVVTDSSYSSPNLAIDITRHTVGEGRGQSVYFVADVYLGDPSLFGACLAGDNIAYGYTEDVATVSEAHGAILAINGDNYCFQYQDENSVTVRDGVVYRAGEYSTADICVLFDDGTMETYAPGAYDFETLMAQGARHIWHFGPALVDENGQAVSGLDAAYWGISYGNPRSAVGYYEPGHYCFLVADGRDIGYSVGLKLSQLAEIMAELGCRSAYNLDGGASSVMYFNGQRVNRQSNGAGRGVGDILYLTDKTGE